jgi:hypothetical protein
MKVKKIMGILISVVLSLTMFTMNVGADDYQTVNSSDSDLVPLVQSDYVDNFTNQIDLSEITGMLPVSSNTINDNTVAGNDLNAQTDNDATNLTGLNIQSSDSNQINSNTINSPGIMPLDSGINSPPTPVYDVWITRIWLGNSSFDNTQFTETLNPNDWNLVFSASDAQHATYVSGDLDATGYSYIRFRINQLGYSSNSSNVKMDGVLYANSYQEGSYDDVFGVNYGFITDYVFAIPTDRSTSNAVFRLIYSSLSNGAYGDQSAEADINWTTPTGQAPTSPSISYNNSIEYGYISGLNNTMEYCAVTEDDTRRDSDLSWTTAPNGGMYVMIYDDEPYIFRIRYKNSTGGNPSLSVEVPVKKRGDAPIYSDDFFYDSEDEYFWLYNDLEICAGDTGGYFLIPANSTVTIGAFIDGIMTNGLNHIYLRYPATATEPASNPWILTLYSRNPNTPTSVVYQNGVLSNLTPNMIMRFGGTGYWYNTTLSQVNITGFMSTSNTTLLEIKYAATSTMSCSDTVEIILPILT